MSDRRGRVGPSTPARRRPGSPAAGTASGSPTASATASPHAIEAFGTKLVVFADSDGALHVLDALLPPHGRRPDPGHDQGRRGRLPVPRLALGRRRPVRRSPVRPAGAAAGPDAVVADAGGEPAAVRLERPAGRAAARPRSRSRGSRARSPTSGATGPGTRCWIDGANCREVIDNVVDMAHFFYIHFAFPTYFKNVLEGHVASQYLETRAAPGHVGTRRSTTSADITLRSEAVVLRPVVHDRLPVARLPRLRRRVRPDQLPLPGHARPRSCCSGA